MLEKLMVVFLLSWASACSTFIPPPKLPDGAAAHPDEAWARVLKRAVDDQGRIDFSLVTREREDLDFYLDYVAKVSPWSHPEMFPSRWDRLAYYINSYNALAMYGVITRHISTGFGSPIDRARFFMFTKYRIGGENISLYNYENDIIRPIGEPRVHFVLNCMVRGCPRLPQVPFRAETLDRQLEQAGKEFFQQTKNFQADSGEKIVRLSEILRFYRADFIKEKATPSLIAYTNRYRKEKVPANFSVEFLPYDWTLNAQ